MADCETLAAAGDGGSGLAIAMNPERWQQVKSVLADALEQPTGPERRAFLSVTCANDTALRREVESLLDQPETDFDTCAETIGLVRPDFSAPGKIGRRLGAYELLRELGRGGMGAVWLARRADQQFQKLVAIKLLKRGTDTDEVLQRFHAERQILARLDHPNISRLLDAGTTDDGLPYFVMEYVEGTRVTDFIHHHHLSFPDRLRLFIKICAAVQFAHQNLVVHRDLKPGNILVTAAGEPKLLDFGVAKLLDPGDEAWQQTIAGRELFTPGYASPEQVRGEAITTVSDVYSLGALLYEILAGVSPHRFNKTAPTATQIAHVVCEEEPSRPSTAATDPVSRRQLRGDLDTILLRALAKAPGRRYRGAGNLADDLQRHLDDRPVRARPDSFGYRTGKFLRRNKAGGAAAALILLTLLAGVVATTRQAQIANRERARAERRFKEVRKIANSLMFEFHDSIADLPGALPARQLVTQRALEYLDSLAQEAGDDLSLRSELAVAYDKIGRLTFDERQAVAAHEKAAALNQGLVQAAPTNAAYRIQLSQSYDALSDTMKIAGRSGPAIQYARKSLNIVESLPGSHPEELAAAHVAVGVVLSDAGDFQGALQEAQTAQELQEKLQTQHPTDMELRWALESSSALLSQAEADAGDLIPAVARAREAVAIARDIFAADPANTRHRRDMWATQFQLGRQLAASGDARAALENYQPALTFLEALAAADPKDTGHRRWLAVTYSAIGDAHARLGEPDAAREFQEKARALSEDLLRSDPERVETERDLIQIEESLGALTLAQGEAAPAREYFADARARAEKLAQRDPANARVQSALAHAYAGLATSDLGLGQNADAENLRQQSRQIWSDLKTRGTLTAADAAASEIELAAPIR